MSFDIDLIIPVSLRQPQLLTYETYDEDQLHFRAIQPLYIFRYLEPSRMSGMKFVLTDGSTAVHHQKTHISDYVFNEYEEISIITSGSNWIGTMFGDQTLYKQVLIVDNLGTVYGGATFPIKSPDFILVDIHLKTPIFKTESLAGNYSGTANVAGSAETVTYNVPSNFEMFGDSFYLKFYYQDGSTEKDITPAGQILSRNRGVLSTFALEFNMPQTIMATKIEIFKYSSTGTIPFTIIPSVPIPISSGTETMNLTIVRQDV